MTNHPLPEHNPLPGKLERMEARYANLWKVYRRQSEVVVLVAFLLVVSLVVNFILYLAILECRQ